MLMPRSRKHFAVTLCAILAFGLNQVDASQSSVSHSGVSARAADEPSALVRTLYDRYPLGSKRQLSSESSRVLKHYFDKRLAGLIRREYLCRRATHEICRDVSDFLVHAQDGVVTQLRVFRGGCPRDCVEARFLNSGVPNAVIFTMTLTSGGWRITDIHYQDGSSLRAMLDVPVPGGGA